METQENIGLRPLEALYLLSLNKQELDSLKNALVCMFVSLYKRQLLLVARDKIHLSKRGRRFLMDNKELDDLEKIICCAIDNKELMLVVQAISQNDVGMSLSEKGMIREKPFTATGFFSFLLSSDKEYALSDSGKSEIAQLISLREKLRMGQPRYTTELVFPSIIDWSNPKMLVIRSYVDRIMRDCEEESRSWLFRGKKYL